LNIIAVTDSHFSVGALEDSMKWESFEVAQLECLWEWDNGEGFFFLRSSA